MAVAAEAEAAVTSWKLLSKLLLSLSCHPFYVGVSVNIISRVRPYVEVSLTNDKGAGSRVVYCNESFSNRNTKKWCMIEINASTTLIQLLQLYYQE